MCSLDCNKRYNFECWTYRQKSYLHLDLFVTGNCQIYLLFTLFDMDCKIQKWRKKMFA